MIAGDADIDPLALFALKAEKLRPECRTLPPHPLT